MYLSNLSIPLDASLSEFVCLNFSEEPLDKSGSSDNTFSKNSGLKKIKNLCLEKEGHSFKSL